MFLETIRFEDGVFHHLEYHKTRIKRALKSVGASPFFTLEALLEPQKEPLVRVRLLYDAKRVKVEYIPYHPKIIRSLKLITCNTLEYHHKYANRSHLDALFVQRGSCDDILIVKEGLITDTSIANIAFFKKGRWYTPATPLLEGTTRARLIDSGTLHVEDITPNDIKGYEKFALLNAMIGFYQVSNGIIEA